MAKRKGSGVVPHTWVQLAEEAAAEGISWEEARSGRALSEAEKRAIRAGCGAFLHKLVEHKIVTIAEPEPERLERVLTHTFMGKRR